MSNDRWVVRGGSIDITRENYRTRYAIVPVGNVFATVSGTGPWISPEAQGFRLMGLEEWIPLILSVNERLRQEGKIQ